MPPKAAAPWFPARWRADAQDPGRALRPDSWKRLRAQASDGDNWPNDCRICRDWLVDKIPPVVRSALRLRASGQPEQNLWEEYAALALT